MFQNKGVGTRRSRGFAARDGSTVKSHSTTTQYRQLRRLVVRLSTSFSMMMLYIGNTLANYKI